MKIAVGQIYLLNESWLEFFEGDLVTISGVDEDGLSGNIGKGLCINKWHVDRGLATLAASAPDADGWREWYRVTDKMPVEYGVFIDVEYTDGVVKGSVAGVEVDKWGSDYRTRGVVKYRTKIFGVEDTNKTPKERDNKYRRKIVDRQTGEYIYADVYDVLEAFNIICSALAHAIKKLLCSGTRHAKSQEQDKKEAIWSVEESLKMDKNSR